MTAGANHRENEVKVAVPDLAALEHRLRAAGFAVVRPRVLESNVIYDTPDGGMRARGELIRIREAGGDPVFTYKGPATVGRHKEREELELNVSDAAQMDRILRRLGFVPRFRYEKFRTEWARPGDEGILMVDETPIGNYMEIEGPGDWIDRLAPELGYSDADYLNLSYARLFVADCARRGVEARDMLFEAREVPPPSKA
jgi:adenylate cyclase, class 2